jgi:hypothetical protein
VRPSAPAHASLTDHNLEAVPGDIGPRARTIGRTDLCGIRPGFNKPVLVTLACASVRSQRHPRFAALSGTKAADLRSSALTATLRQFSARPTGMSSGCLQGGVLPLLAHERGWSSQKYQGWPGRYPCAIASDCGKSKCGSQSGSKTYL